MYKIGAVLILYATINRSIVIATAREGERMKTQVLSLLVDNTSGVLSRVAGMFSRRGFNIDSITAGVTADERYTRITIVTSGDGLVLQQIQNQVAKLEDVVSVKKLERDESVTRELIMVKVKASPQDRQAIMSVVDIFRAKVIDVSLDSMIIELTGSRNKLEAFLELMREHDIVELARTGATALSRGAGDAGIED